VRAVRERDLPDLPGEHGAPCRPSGMTGHRGPSAPDRA
jgi:hypothetical protein